MSPRRVALLVLGVASVSLSSILVKGTDAPALAIAFWRNALSVVLLLPLALLWNRDDLRSLGRRDWAVAVLSGTLLAAHFALWIPSLSFTTIAASTVLVTTQPVWVALIGRLRGELVPRAAVLGIALSLVGAIVISGGDFGTSARAAFGDLLALLGAITAAGYFVAGRSLRTRIPLLPYVSIVYATTSLVLAGAMLVVHTPFGGYDAEVWMLFLLMALIPQIGGHTVFNYLLGHVDASVVAIAVTGEPVGASLLAFAIFGQVPGWAVWVGGPLILAGIYVTVAAETRRPSVAPIE